MAASSGLVSAPKYTFILEVPRLLDTEDMYIIPGTPFMAFSNGVVTVLATTSELAPRYFALIETAGGAMSGNRATGSEKNVSAPSKTKKRDMTKESIGLFINKDSMWLK
ncbi:hypothetical protein GCM10011339_18250 [Echinicola rosea]|uniref:Uncharacterized protein n=1 Tax=Echinicola rosea TaxID=1807691 RepID=A0ABQ1UYH1_9BACT|nr:hypothetical protein GCM10011339_18250 [Echinicola rosea]